MKLPTRLSVALGTAITAAIALAQETDWTHPVKQGIIIIGGLILALIVHPGESGVITTTPTVAAAAPTQPLPPA
jgi:hypothetical protein